MAGVRPAEPYYPTILNLDRPDRDKSRPKTVHSPDWIHSNCYAHAGRRVEERVKHLSVRLILGRAGSGKTWWCQNQICGELSRSLVEGPKLILLVPEQASLQMERGLLAMLETSNVKALGRCEVLSFRRLANRIFAETTGPSPVPLTPLGRQMALRLLISRHRKSLREFARVAERGSFIVEVSRGVAELLQESITLQQLDDAAAAAEESGDPTAARLHDVALLYRAYLEHLGDERVDPEGVLDLARTRMAGAEWLRGARVWIDGFAGLTRQQVRTLVSLSQIASHIDIALLVDPERAAGISSLVDPNSDASIFTRTEQTAVTLLRAFTDAGVKIESAIKLTPATPPRFSSATALATLERGIFNAPPVIKVADHFADGSDSNPESSAQLDDAALSIIRAPTRRDEVDAVLRAVLDLTQRTENPLRYRDIALIVRDLAPYHDILSAALHAHRIPFFIDRRRPMHHHPLVQLVTGLVSLIGGRRFDDAIVRILKTGLSGLTDDAVNAIENYTLAFGLHHPAAWTRRWTRPLPNSRIGDPAKADDPTRVEIALVDSARSTLVGTLGDWWPGETSSRAHPKAATWVRRLHATLQALRVTETLAAWRRAALAADRLDEAAEHEQVWSELMSLLEELDAALGDESMTGRQFREVVESGLSEFTLGLTPPTLDQLLVSSIERSRHPAIRCAFILGFSEGDFPARAREETIFGDAERAFLSARDARLGRTRDEEQLDERALAYIAVTRPSEQLFISYPESSESGRKLEPSSFLNSILGAAPGTKIREVKSDSADGVSTAASLAGRLNLTLRDWAAGRITSAEASPWLAAYDWARKLDDSRLRGAVAASLRALAPIEPAEVAADVAAMLWPAPHRTSVTRLEAFAQCPFKHFARYGLGLTERPEHEVSQMHLGNLYHEVLEQFTNDLIASGDDLGGLSDEEIQRRLTDLCGRILPLYAEKLGLTDDERDKVRWRADLELPFALRSHRATIGRTGLRPKFTEKQFADARDNALPALVLETGNGEVVHIRGKIDRIDWVERGAERIAVVYDYKRALGRRLALDEVYHGLALQLLAYLLVLRDAGLGAADAQIIPGGAFYLSLLGRHIRVTHPSEVDGEKFNPFAQLKPRGVIDAGWIDQLDPTISPPPDSKKGDRGGSSEAFSVRRTKDGELGYLNSSDGLPTGVMPLLLEHVRARMIELAERWLTGDVRVLPIRHGRQTPCSTCPYRSVCRFEFSTHETRALSPLSRTTVIDALLGREPASDDSGSGAAGEEDA